MYTVHACMCIYIYIINIHSTHTYYVNKTLFWMQLITINRLTALIKSILGYYVFVHNGVHILFQYCIKYLVTPILTVN